MPKAKKILLGVTGSIAAYKACEIIRSLQESACDVTVIMTKEAGEFITPLTLGALSGHRVYRGLFDDDNAAWQMGHIVLNQNADALLIAPATANVIGKIASGFADDLLTCVVMATKAPIFIAPAMNSEMYSNKIVRGNIEKLEKSGFKFIYPVKGKLACGVVGDGHLADVEEIVKAVVRSLKDN